MAKTKEVVLDLDYTPRPWQKQFHLGARSKRFAVVVAARQMGKTHLSCAELVDRTLSGPEDTNSAYISPSLVQSRRIAWGRLKQYLAPLSAHLKISETELTILLPGNRKVFLLGLDNESIRGLSLRTIVADEVDLMDWGRWQSVVLPTMVNHGDQASVIFIGTLAAGNSRLWQMYQDHSDDPDWYVQITKATDTDILTDAQLDMFRQQMGDGPFCREFLCDPSAPTQNSVIGDLVSAADADDRVVDSLPIQPTVPVHTAWDIGLSDSSAIWFFQLSGSHINLVRYEEFRNMGLVEIGGRIRKYGYEWGNIILPHDARVRDYSTGVSRFKTFKDLDLGVPIVLPNMPIADTVNAARLNVSRCIFSRDRCERGLDHLKRCHYVLDQRLDVVLDKIAHDQSSHGFDAFRYAMSWIESKYPVVRGGSTPFRRDRKRDESFARVNRAAQGSVYS